MIKLKIVYAVYREEETTVFSSQVLKYLKKLKTKGYEVDLILFRHQKNILKKSYLEEKLNNYVSKCITIHTLPPLFMNQLDFSASLLRKRIRTEYTKNDQLIIMCRGEISTYLAAKAFEGYDNIIFFDNRGVSIEELQFREKTNFLYSLNKKVKERAIDFSKNKCDVYSFVTNNLRDYQIKKYGYHKDKKYFIIPTLCDRSELQENILDDVKKSICYEEGNVYFVYIGSNAMWQSMNRIFSVFQEIHHTISNAKLIVLSKDQMKIPDEICSIVQKSIMVRSVPHDKVKYYLELSKFGFVLRDQNIVNKVAAPTKIAEYMTQRNIIIFDGEIGVLEDLSTVDEDLVNQRTISLSDKNWLEKITTLSQENLGEIQNNDTVTKYFDMDLNQEYLINQLQHILIEKYT